jgi:hypothetical protein
MTPGRARQHRIRKPFSISSPNQRSTNRRNHSGDSDALPKRIGKIVSAITGNPKPLDSEKSTPNKIPKRNLNQTGLRYL